MPHSVEQQSNTEQFRDLKILVFDNPDEILAEWKSVEKYASDYSSCPTWALSWFDAHKDDSNYSPFIIVGKSPTGTIEFLFPFLKWNIGPFAILLRPGVKHSAYYGGIFSPSFTQRIEHGESKKFWEAISESLTGIDAIWVEGLTNAELPKFVDRHIFLSSNPCMKMNLSHHWDTQYLETFNSKTRSNDRRCNKRLSELGEVRFSIIESLEEQKELVSEILTQKTIVLNELKLKSPFEKKQINAFYNNLVDQFGVDENSKFLISKLSVGDKMISANIGIISQSQFHGMIISTTADEEKRFSPGRILLIELNKYLSENGISIHDFGTGNSEFKNSWCTEKIDRFHALIPTSSKGRIVVRIMKVFGIVKGRLKKSKHKNTISQMVGVCRRFLNL